VHVKQNINFLVLIIIIYSTYWWVCSLYPWQLYKGVLCGFLTSTANLILEQFTFINNYTHSYLHPNLVFLVFIWNHIIHLSSTLPSIHQGLIKTKIPFDPQQPWQQLNNYFLICTTFPQPHSLYLFLFSKVFSWSILQVFPQSQAIYFESHFLPLLDILFPPSMFGFLYNTHTHT
jgi:hypothetical protein